MRRSGWVFLIGVLIAGVCAVGLAAPAIAGPVGQTPTGTPTPALQAYQYAVTLGSGNQLIIERTVSYGEISIVVVLLAACVFATLAILIRMVKLWFI